jgi:ribosomal protein L32
VRRALQRRTALVAHTVYECGGCGERSLGERRCAACGLFARALGFGGSCPECDTPVLLSASGTTIHDYTLDFAQNVNFGIRSVLSYMVDPGSASGVTFEMSVSNLLANGTEQFKPIVSATTLPSMPPFLCQEVIDADTFAKVNVTGLGVHKLRIRVTSGAANFSDIVHMYQFST